MINRFGALLAAEDPTITHHWLLPETAEIVYGGLASVIVIGALIKFAGPSVKKSFNARTAKIQKELDDAAGAKVTAESDAKNIRAALISASAADRFEAIRAFASAIFVLRS